MYVLAVDSGPEDFYVGESLLQVRRYLQKLLEEPSQVKGWAILRVNDGWLESEGSYSHELGGHLPNWPLSAQILYSYKI